MGLLQNFKGALDDPMKKKALIDGMLAFGARVSQPNGGDVLSAIVSGMAGGRQVYNGALEAQLQKQSQSQSAQQKMMMDMQDRARKIFESDRDFNYKQQNSDRDYEFKTGQADFDNQYKADNFQWKQLQDMYSNDLSERKLENQEYNDSFNQAKYFDQISQPEAPADEYGRYVAEESKAGRQPLSRIEFSQAKRGNGIEVVTDPETGRTTTRIGGSSSTANEKPFTEGQSKSVIYTTRANAANGRLSELDSSLANTADAWANKIPGVGNHITSEEYKLADQAGREFAAALLRKDTGAAITVAEMDDVARTYLPRPGDTPKVLQQKAESRRQAIAAMEAGMSYQEIASMKDALIPPTGGTPDLSQMSDAELQALIGE